MIRDVVENSLKYSKYFRKHYDVQDYNPTTCQCPYCKGWFEADDSWFKYEVTNEVDYAVIFCPYCGKRFREAI